MRIIFTLLTFLLLPVSLLANPGDIVLENDDYILTLSGNGYASSLLLKSSGEECLETGVRLPLCSILQNRPYDNETQLIQPVRPTSFPSCAIRRDGNTLEVRFHGTCDVVKLELDVRPHYMGFKVVARDYDLAGTVGVKRKTEIDALTYLQLPVKNRDRFGAWMGVCWDDAAAVCLLATDMRTRIDGDEPAPWRRLYATSEQRVGLLGTGSALVATSTDKLFDAVACVEEDFGLPRGVESRRRSDYSDSYYEVRWVTPANVDENIRYAREGGFRAMVIYYPDFAWTCGHFLWNQSYPNGMEDLKAVVARMKDAGMKVGFHIHYNKVSVDDPYVKDGDPRLAATSYFILPSDICSEDSEIPFIGGTQCLLPEPGRRMIQIDRELILYQEVKDGRFVGCRRGLHGTVPAVHSAGTSFIQPEVDDWTRFIRIDQESGIQEELSDRLAAIYNECGFDFIYFDGAEDVQNPYWYQASKAQMSVYDRLVKKPIYNEAAVKTHFAWHLISRANAFDHFTPEDTRTGMKTYILPCAALMADNFSSIDFGWMDTRFPDDKTIGMQPDMYEYICSKAAAWNSPVSLVAHLDRMAKTPHNSDNLRVMREWEEFKRSGRMTSEQRDALRNPDREFFLLNGEIIEYKQLTPDSNKISRAFVFERGGRACALVWSVASKKAPALKLGRHLRRRYALGDRTVLETDLSMDKLCSILHDQLPK
ncbi:MAG: hypothetical protein IJQ93_07300 [Bacteroidales bacterium]|nr:hypothetical protein [Bacteroidales bacterium]